MASLRILAAATVVVAACTSAAPAPPPMTAPAAPAAPASATVPPEAAAQQAAEAWLPLVDAGRFQESWEQAAPAFRAAVTPEGWTQAAQATRGPLGSLGSRTLRDTRYTTELQGAPAGEYVVVQYESSFASLPQGVETVVLTRAPTGWRVAGYFVRPAP